MEPKVVRFEITFSRPATAVLLVLLLLVALTALLWTTGIAVASPGDHQDAEPQNVTGIAALVGTKIHYQGRLEGASGPLTMTFRLWNDETSTLAPDLLWEETKLVTPISGLFNTQLGDTTPLAQLHVNGQELWLGVKVGDDDEMVPRQEILPVPYALSLRPGAVILDEDLPHTTLYAQNGDTGVPPGVMDKRTILAVTSDGTAVTGRAGSGVGVSGSSVDGDGIRGYSTNGRAGWFSGDVAQTLPSDGLVKAAVFAYCDDDPSGSQIKRYFNNVNSSPITIMDGSGEGRCVIDFDFNVNERYIVAVANVTQPGGYLDRAVMVRNSELAPFDRISVFRFDTSSGSGAAGDIAILVY